MQIIAKLTLKLLLYLGSLNAELNIDTKMMAQIDLFTVSIFKIFKQININLKYDHIKYQMYRETCFVPRKCAETETNNYVTSFCEEKFLQKVD